MLCDHRRANWRAHLQPVLPQGVAHRDPYTSMQLTSRRLQVASHPPARDDQEAVDGLDRADLFLAQLWGDR